MNLSPRIKIVRCLGAVAAGTSTQVGTTVDMKGFRGCTFIYDLGACTDTAVPHCKVLEGTDSGGSGATAIAGTSAQATASSGNLDNKGVVVDVYRPNYRYLTPQILRTTANVVIGSIYAILYDPIDEPVTASTTILTTTALTDPA